MEQADGGDWDDLVTFLKPYSLIPDITSEEADAILDGGSEYGYEEFLNDTKKEIPQGLIDSLSSEALTQALKNKKFKK